MNAEMIKSMITKQGFKNIMDVYEEKLLRLSIDPDLSIRQNAFKLKINRSNLSRKLVKWNIIVKPHAGRKNV